MRFENHGYTGGIAEKELIGSSGFEKNKEHFEYIPRRQAFEVVKSMQKFDSTDPDPDFANAVHALIFEELGLSAENLHFYSAVGSPLDLFHGVDAWFELDNGKRVTIDLTMNPNKDEYKADIVFLVPTDGLDRKVDNNQFMEYSKKLAQEVIVHFQKA